MTIFEIKDSLELLNSKVERNKTSDSHMSDDYNQESTLNVTKKSNQN